MVDKLSYQKLVWLENRNKIIQLLIQQPLTFKEIIEKSGLSRAVVNQHLKSLEKEGIITKIYKEGKILNAINFEKARKTLVPLLFASMAGDYVLGVKQDFLGIDVKEKEKEVEFKFHLRDLFKGLSPEKRLHAIARRQLAVQLFALLKAVETGDFSWLMHIPLGLIGDFWLFAQLDLPFEQFLANETAKLQKILESKRGEIIMILETPSFSVQVRENFAEKLRELLERAFPEEMKQIKQIYEEATKFKDVSVH